MLRPLKRVFQLGVAVERAETEIRQSLFQRLVQAIGGAKGEEIFDAGPGVPFFLFYFNQQLPVKAGGAR